MGILGCDQSHVCVTDVRGEPGRPASHTPVQPVYVRPGCCRHRPRKRFFYAWTSHATRTCHWPLEPAEYKYISVIVGIYAKDLFPCGPKEFVAHYRKLMNQLMQDSSL